MFVELVTHQACDCNMTVMLRPVILRSCESSNRHPCYKCQGFPSLERILPWQLSVAGKEEVGRHNCILFRIMMD